MLKLPSVGDQIYVWPHPIVRVQAGMLPLSAGGRWLPPEGRQVIWDEYRYRQLLAGELHLTDPRPSPAPKAQSATAPAARKE